MPATEKTWYDMKVLHVAFGATGLLLLIASIAMLGADHSREWKQYQRKMRKVDSRLTLWRMQAEQTQQSVDTRRQLEDELAAARAQAPDADVFGRFLALVRDPDQGADLQRQYERMQTEDSSAEDRVPLHDALIDSMKRIVQRAKFQEDTLLSERKFKSADLDESRANFDLAVRDERTEALPALQAEIDQLRQQRDELTVKYQEATAYRKSLQDALNQITAPVDALQRQLADNQAEYDRLASSLDDRTATYFTSRPPFLGKKWLEIPVFDAFNSPLKIQNLWTKNLTMPNGSFGAVRRFDRCTTCHQAIDRTAAGSAVLPLYEAGHERVLQVTPPESRPESLEAEEQGPLTQELLERSLREIYGLELADNGLVEAGQVTVRRVLPETLAATAALTDGMEDDSPGFGVGDVLLYVNQDKVLSLQDAYRFLLRDVRWGEPLSIRVRRGLPQPFSSHPRLDLFVGSLSPHKVSVFGCTVCHEGQGSATSFKWASHTPNDPEQQQEWYRDHGWFNNHHWIYPMYPRRFAQSACVKCHHEIEQLEVSDQFAEPPAPKLVEGYQLVREYGCFGCHEINGYSGPESRVGPDMRLEPNYSGAAAQIKSDPNYTLLTDETRDWVGQLVQHPDRDAVRHRLLQFLKEDAAAEQAVLTSSSHRMMTVLADAETPGTLRKAGPSLRHIAEKVGPTWMYDWIREPADFRPNTRMPRFFGHWDHLDADERALAERYEPVEILGVVTYLLKRSQPLEFVEPSAPIENADDAAVERGKRLFETRGCLACHAHADFPAGKATQGPELSNLADKFSLPDTPAARRWLYSWLRSPMNYHPRTKMPDLDLRPIAQEDGTLAEPAADIAAYLLTSSTGWQPAAGTTASLTPNSQALDGLVLEHLKTKIYLEDARRALEEGQIPAHLEGRLEGAETILSGKLDQEKKLLYVGHKTITKYGCFGCHDIPGFEDAKPIGTGLADWGRKDPSRLAFEHIAEYVGHGSQHGHAADDHAATSADDSHAMADTDRVEGDAATEFDETFYLDRLLENDRVGFIWQKLKEPRSYDFRKARNRDSYNDRLRMPLFGLSPQQRESVITFVLGLVAEPPPYEFVYHPDERKQAFIAGRRALEKYNCTGCHMLEPEKWTIEFPSGEFGAQASSPESTYPFMKTHFPSDQVQASQTVDPMDGTVRTTLRGMPTLTRDGQPMVFDDYGDPLEEGVEYDPKTLLHMFDLWEPVLIEGETYEVGLSPLEIPATMIKRQQPSDGGDFVHWLLPRVTELEQEVNPQADGKQAYGWLPPPLIGEGRKIQSEWLYQFLLQPFPIRPAAILRMPRFNLAPQEATDLVNYFAARDNADYPYESTERTQEDWLVRAEQHYAARLDALAEDQRPRGQTRLDDAMNIVASGDYCVKCHLVGDYEPEGDDRAKAPNLSVVGERLRPEYMRRWIANPVQILPYTPMPVNIKYDANDPEFLGGVDQLLYRGTSVEQVDALVDLLMNYPRFTQSRAAVSQWIKESLQTTPAATQPSAAGTEPAAEQEQTEVDGS
jgi:cytochrome c551/c552